MSRRFTRFLVIAGSLLLIVCLVAGAVGVWLPRRSFPQIDGEVRLPGLNARVDIFRDDYGIPQIYASTAHDLFFAQGYVQAQDRFWQMDVSRHIGSGRLSEMFGSSTVSTDQFLRTLQLERLAQQEQEMLDASSRLALESFAEGVNAYLANHKGTQVSLEYAVLGVISSGYQPAEWQPLHTLTWAKMMAWDLGGNMDDEIMRAVLMKTLTPEQIDDLFTPYPSDHPVIVPGYQPGGVGTLAPSDAHLLSDLTPALEGLGSRLEQVNGWLRTTGADSSGIGSNDWVISGERTATGMPILADDPHLGVQMPSIWYEVGLHCTIQGSDCPYEVTGFTFPSSPGVVVGHNDRIAWGVTNVGPDVQDLFIEKINPANPDQYEYQGEWIDMQAVDETITIAGGDPVTLTVRTTRHGPLITDLYGPLEGVFDSAELGLPAGSTGYAIALQWTALQPSRIYQAILELDRAQNWDDFRTALSSFNVPSQNFVYADVDGNIGYQMPGDIPLRAAGDGRLPVPGWTGEYEWTGFIPFDELPNTFNPQQGYVATANNAVVGSDYPYLISTDWDKGYRAQRIVEMIENAPGPIDIAYIQKMHGDDKNLNAETLVPLILQLQLSDDGLTKAQALLKDWDYQQTMDSPAAALFEVFWKNLLAVTFHDDLPEEYWPTGSSGWFEIVRRLAAQPDSPWWDNQPTPVMEVRDDMLYTAFQQAVAELEQAQGKDPTAWRWGKLHTVTFVNGTLGSVPVIGGLFNRGPYETSGGASIVNATSWNAVTGYQVRSLPSMRMIVDLSNLQNSLAVNTTGQSGHAYHPHYVDLVDLWRNIQYHPMQWDRQSIEAEAEGHLLLTP